MTDTAARSPVLLIVDPDLQARNAIQTALERRFGQDYRVVIDASAKAALETLTRLASDHDDRRTGWIQFDDTELSRLPTRCVWRRAHVQGLGTDAALRGAIRERWPIDRPPLAFETSMPGVFAVGDVRHGSVKRVAGAVGEGSVAIGSVHQYLAELDGATTGRHR